MPSRFPANMRARDEDRVHACASLDRARADGQLPQDEYELRIELAKDANTLADLHDLIDDLQGDTELVDMAPPGLGVPGITRRSRPSVRRGVVTWLVTIGVVAGVVLGVRACMHDDSATGRYGSAGYLAPAAFADILASATEKAGTSTVDEITFRPDSVYLDIPDPDTPRKQLSFAYRNGEWDDTFDGDRDPNTPQIDLAAFDASVLAGIVAGAGASLNLGHIDEMYLFLRATEDGPEINLHAGNDDNEDGYLDATPSGDPIRVTPFDPNE